MKKAFNIVIFLVVLINCCFAKQLVLPKNTIAFSSLQGQYLLKSAPEKYSQQYWQLAEYFTTEKGTTFCGPASAVMVLNALKIEPSLSPAHMQYSIFDQNNIFYNKALIKSGITPQWVYAKGLSIEQTAELINKQKTIGPKAYAKVIHASEFKNQEQFLNTTLSSMKKGDYIIINYKRSDMGAQGGGHFSPLAAYNPKEDMWLLMDVARYKYPSAWIRTIDLYQAIQSKDSSTNKSRGIIIISKKKY
ncbi:phytochelatin synthase family protein [Francisella salimarina]|uniref:Phytochelatin synthase family protein n=1 Tax=Francisella salimarina TaxID=2599927 RepID=A0AAJ4NQS5_9GAMM|nr:phytochelatin synthase family protein [Francisella salimarina]QWV00146.1 phytochelatin synthase family protein [Francisella salimarina]